jgi:hypothetical protein
MMSRSAHFAAKKTCHAQFDTALQDFSFFLRKHFPMRHRKEAAVGTNG